MKIILVGYPGSQHIVPASKYLTGKYLPDFDIHYLNWIGEKDGWSNFVGSYLAHLEDDLVIFALDDYLLNSPLNRDGYKVALRQFNDPNVVCVKLCPNTPEEHEGYPVTTQYMIWKREYLVDLLSKTTNPWDFEIKGSKILMLQGKFQGKKSVLIPCLDYPTHSCLSERWSGVRLDGVKEEDVNYLKQNGYI